MSRQLALSVAISVMLMAGFVLFDSHSTHVSLGPDSLSGAVSLSAPQMPSLFQLLPALR